MEAEEGRVAPDKLRIQVLEGSVESGIFVVRIWCRDPILLGFWKGKALFRNGQVEQAGPPRPAEGGALEFVLRVLHRSPRISNAHYWSPFTMTLCLDALSFCYRLVPGQAWSGNSRDNEGEKTLVLTR